MRRDLRTTVAVVAVMLFLAIGVLVARSLLGGGAATYVQPTAKEKAVLVYLNQQRRLHGLSLLHFDPVLAKYAKAHTSDMLEHDYFSHDVPNGPDYGQRVHGLLLQPGRHVLEENIAYGTGSYGTAKALVADWMASPGHRANILNPAVHRTGQGIASGSFQGNPVAVVATSEFSN